MPYIYIPMWVDQEVFEKLNTGEYERAGGVIRRSDNKRIVCWLKQEGEIPKNENPKFDPLFKILVYSWDVKKLSDTELIILGEYINKHEILSELNFYSGSRIAVEQIVKKYYKLIDCEGKEKADEYASLKRNSLVNIFSRTFIPNLKHQLELEMIKLVYDEENGIYQLFLKGNDEID